MEKDIIERIAIVETKQDAMGEDVREIKAHVAQLTVLANRGRGGLAAIWWAGGCVVALAGLCASVIGFIKGVTSW